MKPNDKDIRDTFLDNFKHYRTKVTSDDYTASQFASIATQEEYGISKDQLLKILRKG